MKRFFKALGVLFIYGLVIDMFLLLFNYIKSLIKNKFNSKTETQ